MTNFFVAYIIVGLRCFTDAIYIAHFRCEICKENFREVITAGNLAVTLCTFLKHLLNFLNCLPILQIVVLIFTSNHGSSTSSVENILHALCLPIVFQYIVRTFTSFPFHGYQSARCFIFEDSLTNCLINAFKFILVGHVVGSCWYIFGLKQMASYASSLVPSYAVWKCLFMMSILILRVFFFSTIILNIENIVAPVRRLLENLQRLGDVDRLTDQDDLPHELRRRVREAEQFRLTEAVNEKELVRSFSLDLQNELWQHFSQGFHFFTHLEADLRMTIYAKLKQNVYRNNSCIIVPHCPIDDVIFIVGQRFSHFTCMTLWK